MATTKSVLQVFGLGLAIAAAVMVVGLVATMTKQPVAIVVTVGIACLLTGLALEVAVVRLGGISRRCDNRIQPAHRLGRRDLPG